MAVEQLVYIHNTFVHISKFLSEEGIGQLIETYDCAHCNSELETVRHYYLYANG